MTGGLYELDASIGAHQESDTALDAPRIEASQSLVTVWRHTPVVLPCSPCPAERADAIHCSTLFGRWGARSAVGRRTTPTANDTSGEGERENALARYRASPFRPPIPAWAAE